MDAAEYFLPNAADLVDLTAWATIIPASVRILRTNLFGDVFIVDESGAVYMLERAACAAEQVAPSEEDFWRQAHEDAQGWQLRPLVENCRQNGKVLSDGQCYAFTTLPVLGGRYNQENVWVAAWEEWFSFTADVFEQIKDLPDGAAITFKVAD